MKTLFSDIVFYSLPFFETQHSLIVVELFWPPAYTYVLFKQKLVAISRIVRSCCCVYIVYSFCRFMNSEWLFKEVHFLFSTQKPFGSLVVFAPDPNSLTAIVLVYTVMSSFFTLIIYESPNPYQTVSSFLVICPWLTRLIIMPLNWLIDDISN